MSALNGARSLLFLLRSFLVAQQKRARSRRIAVRDGKHTTLGACSRRTDKRSKSGPKRRKLRGFLWLVFLEQSVIFQ
jgi:hypothetical protein